MTSLSEQLKRLRAPQTSILVDSKIRPSILFDPKEAALKDRETIFEIGYSGLQELIAINPSFMQFEATLFDKNAKEMQRAVESKEVNRLIDETIKKFLIQLSPYLLLQASHKCIEWLIRRFNINDYNRDELMMLILPYHETKIFVKCIQTMKLSNPSEKWYWLQVLQAPGVPLSKQALLNRTASDEHFLNFICQSIIYATEELETKLNSLQVYYAFFCTTVIGAIELRSVNESQVVYIYKALRKGLKSNSVDFCAASLMIIGQLVSKTSLSTKILEKIVFRLLKIPHVKLQNDIIVLLVLIYRNQQDNLKEIPSECFPDIVHCKWISQMLVQLQTDGAKISPFFIPLLGSCLRAAQLIDSHTNKIREFCNVLLDYCFFSPDEARDVIRCVLDSYILPDKNHSVITIDSENEENEDDGDGDVDMEISNQRKNFKKWFKNLLKSLERKYSSTFDGIVKEIIKSKDPSISESKKKSLKTALGFFFTTVCTEDNANLFEKLYHHNSQHRVEAIKYLVHNFEKISFSDDSKGLLKSSITERLSDDSPAVVIEALKFSTKKLQTIVDNEELYHKLISILEKTMSDPNGWEAAGFAAVKHLTSSLLVDQKSNTTIFIAILPFLLQSTTFDVSFIHQIFNSNLKKFIPFIATLATSTQNKYDKNEIFQIISEEFESKRGLPIVENVITFIKRIPDDSLTVSKAFYSMLLLGYSIGTKCSPETSLEILEIIKRFEKLLKTAYVKNNAKWMVNVALGLYPVNLNIGTIKNIIDGTDFNDLMKPNALNFASNTSKSLILLRKLFEILIDGMSVNNSNGSKYELFANGINKLFEKVLITMELRIEFFANYFIIDFLEMERKEKITINGKSQVYIINYFNNILASTNDLKNIKLNLSSFIRIISGMRSHLANVREATFETLTTIVDCKSNYQPLIIKLLKRRDEIVMDENQLPLILFTIHKESSKELKTIFDEFIIYLAILKEDKLNKILLLEILTHVNTIDVIKSVTKLASNVLKISKENHSSTNKPVTLNRFDSLIMQNILSRFSQQTIKFVKKEIEIWQTILESVSESYILIQCNGKILPITNITVDIFDDEMFSELTLDLQKPLLKAIVCSVAFSDSVELTSSVNKLIKQLSLNAKTCTDILDGMAQADGRNNKNSQSSKITANISSNFKTISPDVLKTSAWKCGVAWLELLQNKKQIKNTQLLIPSLFSVLQICLEFEDQSGVEYAKQLVLACILQSCEIIKEDSGKGKLPEKAFKVELVVKCIRGTQNPQTHHHALQLLAYIATLLPDQVLHNMMDIFTFMGSSVVRHDDAYSFQIIKNIISSIIPTLIKTNENKSEEERNGLVLPVLKVFSDILLDVPEHRRVPLYVKLIETLGANDYLWMFLAVLIESHVAHEEKDKIKSQQRDRLKSELPRRIEIALALTKQFSCETIIDTTSKMIRFLHKMPILKPTQEESSKISQEISNIFDVNAATGRQNRYYKYAYIQFISNLTSSTDFVNKIAQLGNDETIQMKKHYQDAIISILTFIPDVSRAAEQDTTHAVYWKALLHNSYDILENIISLLSSNTLLLVVEGLLLKDKFLPSVRRKVIEMLINKLQYKTEFFVESDEENLVRILDPLVNIIESIIDKSKLVQSTSQTENISIQQMSLLAIKLISKLLAHKYPAKFKYIMETLIEVLRSNEEVPRILLATVLLCLSEICSNLRAHSIAYLPNFMKIFLNILEKHATAQTFPNDTVLVSLITALFKIIGTLPLFMSPYLADLIVKLCRIWDRVDNQVEKDVRLSTILSRLTAIWDKLSSTLPMRVLLPSIDRSYIQLISNGKYNGVAPLMILLSKTFDQQDASTIAIFMPDITSLFVTALQVRDDSSTDIDLVTINQLEDKIIESFVSLTLKLSEGSFRPLYCHVFDWAAHNENDTLNANRCVTFYKLSARVAKALKSLYVLFASDVVEKATEILSNSQELSSANENEFEISSLLLTNVIETLHQIFLHDSQGFINGNRFEMVMQPLVDQIENEIILKTTENKNTLSTAIAQFGVAANDDIHWKQLNYQILMKTRSNSSEARLLALKVCVEFASKLSEDYMPLLPETVPFLSELLEDENADVERECQQSVQELERILGENLQKYF